MRTEDELRSLVTRAEDGEPWTDADAARLSRALPGVLDVVVAAREIDEARRERQSIHVPIGAAPPVDTILRAQRANEALADAFARLDANGERADRRHWLRVARERAGWTMGQLADALGVAVVVVSDVEMGRRG